MVCGNNGEFPSNTIPRLVYRSLDLIFVSNRAKELADCKSESQQISHLKKILTDLGMSGRMSLEQAKVIREKRELRQEIGSW